MSKSKDNYIKSSSKPLWVDVSSKEKFSIKEFEKAMQAIAKNKWPIQQQYYYASPPPKLIDFDNDSEKIFNEFLETLNNMLKDELNVDPDILLTCMVELFDRLEASNLNLGPGELFELSSLLKAII